MQRCPDCGHSNRPEVRFCTHCGKPEPASGTITTGPTTIVAVVVLAVGLLVFLSIRPVTPRQAGTVAVGAPAQIVGPSDASGVARVERSDAAALPVVTPTEATAEAIAPIGAVADVQAVAARAALAASLPAIDSAVPPSTGTTTPVEPPPAPDSAMSASGPAPDVPDSGQLVLPAADPLAMPASPSPPAPRQHVAGPAQHEESASRAHVWPPSVSASASASAPSSPSPALSSPAEHAADGAAPARRVASRPGRSARWLNQLRAELAACEGDFFTRTICREKAKFRHCAPADGWGKVAECPAAALPGLANYSY